ncbi:MAG: acetylglutamate kinase [Planctomycetaceae bacterium]|nr:acetylglutamate kinase [Planctomycetaceae bacterium]
MLHPVEKADVLIEALHWIREFRDKVFVIKLGGSLMTNPLAMSHLLQDVVFLETVGIKPIVVHGGGPAINRAMLEAGLQSRFVLGRRYTCEKTLAIVERVLANEVNEQIVEQITILGGKAKSLNFNSKCIAFGEPIKLKDDDGNLLDVGYVGTVTRVDRKTIEELLQSGTIPVIPSMCLTEEGQKLNVNADTVAMVIAQEFKAEKLVYLSDINGVRADKDDPESLIPTLTPEMAEELFRKGVIQSGMIPKVQACLATVEKGVRKVHIVDGRLRHSLLLEIFTTFGIGTEIVSSTHHPVK